MPNAKITAVGCYAPPGLLTNADLAKLVDTSDEWIKERTGISQRHIAAPEVATSDMAVEAARLALERRGMDPNELEAIIVGTVTPDMLFPSTACLVQNRLGIERVWGFDLFAGCCGYLYSLSVGAHLVMAGTHKKVMVIGADTMSRVIDYQDRSTCILFGDAAGAVILEACDEGEGMLDLVHYVDGSGGKYLQMPAGGSRLPASEETVRQRLHYARQDGPHVYKFAVRNMYETCHEVLSRNGFTADDVNMVIPHQANLRIITATADRLGVPLDRVMINIERYGNTTGGTIPLATEEAIATGRLKKGHLVLFAAVGAGYTAGASLWRWAY